MSVAPEPHPEVQAVLDQIAALDVTPLADHGPQGARELFANLRPDVEGPTVGDVADLTVPGFDGGDEVPVRVYTPDADGPFPTLVYFHGGGWVIGSVETHDLLCRYLTTRVDAQVVSVEYRLAPEHPFPAALEDCYAGTTWAAAGPADLDSDGNLAVAGDSAGGNLAAATTLLARDVDDGPGSDDAPSIDAQVLLYPAVSTHYDWASIEEFAEGYFLNRRDMEWFGESYLGSPIHAANPYAAPLVAPSHEDLPPATVVTAGFDPLRDQGVAYAEALADDGVAVTHRNYDDMIHGFVSMLEGLAELDAAHEAVDDIAEDLHAAWD